MFWTPVGVSVGALAAHQGILWVGDWGELILFIWGLGLVGVGCCGIGWKSWILHFSPLGCLGVYLVFLMMNQKRTRSKTVSTFGIRPQMGQGPLVSLPRCGQTDIPGTCGELSGSGGKRLGVRADPGNWCKVLLASACVCSARGLSAACWQSPEACECRPGEEHAFGVRLSPM